MDFIEIIKLPINENADLQNSTIESNFIMN